jgi:hypothetical protein
MSYENPVRVSYHLGNVAGGIDFGAGDSAYAIKPPKDKSVGQVVDIHLSVIETFNQVTTPGYVRLGTSGDADKYAQLNCGAAAATNAYNMDDAGTWGDMIDLVADSISQVEVVCIAPTGGTPAGIACVTLVIDWF